MRTALATLLLALLATACGDDSSPDGGTDAPEITDLAEIDQDEGPDDGPTDVIDARPDDGGAEDEADTPEDDAVADTDEGADPPQVTAVEPGQACGSGGPVTVTGASFLPGAVVLLDDAALPTTFVDASTLTAVLDGSAAPGLHDVSVRNPDGAVATRPDGIEVLPAPELFFVDPPVVHSSARFTATVHGTGFSGTVTDVSLAPEERPADGVTLVFAVDPAAADRIGTVIPSGLAPGEYRLAVTDELGCRAELPSAVTVVEALSLALERVEPPTGWTGHTTTVHVYSTDPAPAGAVSFAATPRLYLVPADAAGGTPAVELRLRSFRTPRGTDATVPAGLPVGSYDLLAVNPDGTVGLLPAAFRVAAAAPPRISALSPTSVTGWGTRTVTVLGEHFDDPTVAVTCRLPAGTFVAPSVTRIAFDADSIEFSVDLGTTPVVAGATCMVRVTNADGAYDSSSALGVVNVSYNLDSFTPAPNLRVPRRAPCAVAAEAAPGVRRVYAIGGDDGTNRETTATTRYDSIESAAVGPHGDVSDWSLESSTLPVPLSFHGCAALGRFVYVVGGSDGTSAIATAYRGQILDPEQAPALADGRLAVHPEEPAVFTAGSYSYRIAATLPSDHPENPGGETLAGDALTVQVPVLSVGLSITLSWNEFPGAAGYRVYRTPTPGLAADEARLLAVLPPTARTFEDDGSAATGLETALPLGAMGRFAVLPALTTPREGMGVALAADPTDPTISYLYVLGGRTSGHTALAGVEWLAIQVETDGRQTVADAWTAGAASIGTPRWQLAAFVADSRTAPATVAPGTTWIYAGGGFAADVSSAYPTPLNDTVALRVASGGALGEGAGNRWVVDNMQPESAGYAGIVLLDQLFVFGGGHGLPGSQGFSIRICTNDIASCSGGPPAAPDLGNWNNIGLSMSHARYLPGATSLGIFVFLVGGVEGWDLPWHPLAAVETIHG